MTDDKVLDQHIVAERDGGPPDTLGGKARIVRGRRISVEDIAIWHVSIVAERTVDEICAEFDLSLGRDSMPRSLYYYDHQSEIERAID